MHFDCLMAISNMLQQELARCSMGNDFSLKRKHIDGLYRCSTIRSFRNLTMLIVGSDRDMHSGIKNKDTSVYVHSFVFFCWRMYTRGLDSHKSIQTTTSLGQTCLCLNIHLHMQMKEKAIAHRKRRTPPYTFLDIVFAGFYNMSGQEVARDWIQIDFSVKWRATLGL